MNKEYWISDGELNIAAWGGLGAAEEGREGGGWAGERFS